MLWPVEMRKFRGHIKSKSGVSIHQIPHIFSIVKNTKPIIDGIHIHSASDILDINLFLRASEILFKTASQFKNLEFIDFGSGFKVPYREGDKTNAIWLLSRNKEH